MCVGCGEHPLNLRRKREPSDGGQQEEHADEWLSFADVRRACASERLSELARQVQGWFYHKMFILVGSAPVGSGIIAAGSRAHAEAPSRACADWRARGPGARLLFWFYLCTLYIHS